MPSLPRSLQAWGTPDFETALKQEVAASGVDLLPLQQGLGMGSVALADKLGIMILASHETPGTIHVRVGAFYTSIIAGCACADDPTPVDENTEYCTVNLEIDRRTGAARASLVTD